jgi:hypothetical protein
MENIRLINQALIREYGTGIHIPHTGETLADSRPRFRIVWSDEQFELRKGEFNIFSGPIYLRTEEGTRKVRKYSYISEKWVLEKLVFSPTPELPESEKGHYEIVWVFQTKDGQYLKPIWKAVNLLVQTLLGRSKWHKTEKETDTEEKESFENEIKEFEEMLDISSPLQTQFRHGEAIRVPATISRGEE